MSFVWFMLGFIFGAFGRIMVLYFIDKYRHRENLVMTTETLLDAKTNHEIAKINSYKDTSEQSVKESVINGIVKRINNEVEKGNTRYYVNYYTNDQINKYFGKWKNKIWDECYVEIETAQEWDGDGIETRYNVRYVSKKLLSDISGWSIQRINGRILKADFEEVCRQETNNKKWVDISSVLEYFYDWDEKADREEIYDRIKECLYLIIDRLTFRDYYHSEDYEFGNANKSFKPLDEYVEFVRADKEDNIYERIQ